MEGEPKITTPKSPEKKSEELDVNDNTIVTTINGETDLPTSKDKETKESNKKRSFLRGIEKLARAGFFVGMTSLLAGEFLSTEQVKSKKETKVEDTSDKSEQNNVNIDIYITREEERLREWKKRWPTASEVEKDFAMYTGRFPTEEEMVLVTKAKELESLFGRENVPALFLDKVESKDLEQEESLEAIITTDIVGAEGIVSKSVVAEVFAKFPRGWVSNEVTSISQSLGEFKKTQDKYGIKDGVTVASCRGGFMEDKATIVLYEPTVSSSLRDIFETFTHELAHANDWNNDSEMSYRERLELLEVIGKRLSAPDRHKSWYVESIQNSDKKEERSLKAGEYWAEIVSQYFTDPNKLHILDFKIVDKHVRKQDPGYDIVLTRNTIDKKISSATATTLAKEQFKKAKL